MFLLDRQVDVQTTEKRPTLYPTSTVHEAIDETFLEAQSQGAHQE